MPARTGKIILAKNIKLDRDYKNIMNYTENQMVTLVTTNAVYTSTNCSFVRPDGNEVVIDATYSTCLNANYMAFQNPDYNNKWFFAFIDDIRYESNGATRITFTIDECTTWFDYWHVEPCFVIREHTNDDTIGNNLLPENLELGEYVANGNNPKSQVGFGDWGFSGRPKAYLLQTSYYPDGTQMLGVNVDGIPMAGGLLAFQYWQQMVNAIQKISSDGHLEDIHGAFILDTELARLDTVPNQYWTLAQITSGQEDTNYWKWNGTKSPFFARTVLARPATIDGYTPKNNKLLTAPFQFLMLTNNSGSATTLNYEYFNNPASLVIEAKGTICVGGSAIVYPENYKHVEKNYTEAITQGKYPTLSWSGDAYTNWLTQNSVNIGLGVVGDVIGLATGMQNTAQSNEIGAVKAASAGMAGHFTPESQAGNLINFGMSIAGTVANIYQHSICPQTVRGNTNCGDVMTADCENTVFAIKMSITSQFARIIDDYFTRKGYATNRIKVPNQTGRTYWNYVQIAAEDDIGYSSNANISVPSRSMEIINNVYRKGVTIWHDHANIGDFSLNNTIVTP